MTRKNEQLPAEQAALVRVFAARQACNEPHTTKLLDEAIEDLNRAVAGGRYDVELHWAWGSAPWSRHLGPPLPEVHRFTVSDREEIDAEVRRFITSSMTDRYAFDCGRLDHPLNPTVRSLTITPIGEREFVDVHERYAACVKENVERVRGRLEEQEREARKSR